MFDNLLPTYRKKVIALMVGGFLFLILAYWLSFSKTLAVYQQHTNMQNRLEQAGTVQQDMAHYQQLLGKLNQQQRNRFDERILFEFVTNFCQEHNLIIQDMPSAQVFEQDEHKIMTNFIQVQGTFVAMTKLIYVLEQKEKMGHIVSCNYSLEKNRESRREELVASIYLQNIQAK